MKKKSSKVRAGTNRAPSVGSLALLWTWMIRFWPALTLVFLGLVVFGRLLGHDFVLLDDEANIYQNPLMAARPLSHLHTYWEGAFIRMYIPVTYTAWAGVAQWSLALWGRLDPWPFHAVNLLFHLLNSLCVFHLIRKFLPQASPESCLAGAVLFLLHPMQVEPVAWVTGFKDVFSAFWVFCSLALLFQASRKEEMGWRWWMGAWICFLLAILSKPSQVFLVACVVWWEWHCHSLRDFRVWARIGAFVVPALGTVFFATRAQDTAQTGGLSSWLEKLWVASDASLFYLTKTFYPWPMTIDYGRTTAVVLESSLVWIPVGVLLVLGMLVLFFRKCPGLMMGLVFWALALAPSMGWVPFYFQNISNVADRYQYVALAGIALALVGSISWVPPRWALAGGGLLALVLSALTLRVAANWRDSRTLFDATLAANPSSWLAHVNYSAYLVDRGRAPEAVEMALRAIDLNSAPHLRVAALYNLANAYFDMKDYASALQSYGQALEISPHFAKARANRALVYLTTGEPEKAVADQRMALKELGPDPVLRVQHAIALDRMGQHREAYAQLLEAERLGHTVDARLMKGIKSRIPVE
ncbi:MAG: tetratricopeptide repeat protein [Candidatus Methylacidiphilales bacterium]|nr:tetratricopeptide repeat protein [Candidatus Methylacidiphilales bacterium]